MLRQWKKVNNDVDFVFNVADAAEAVYNAAKLVWLGIGAYIYLFRTVQCLAKPILRPCKRPLRYPQQ